MKKCLERFFRYLLFSAYFRLVWEGYDFAWLLDLLGSLTMLPDFFLTFWCYQLIASIFTLDS